MTQPSDPGAAAAAQVGRVALVIGGESGLGAVVVRALAATGHAVAIHAHAALDQARALVDRLAAADVAGLAVTADLRDEGPLRTLVHRVADHFGRLDAVVVCAAVAHPCRLEDVTAADLRTHFDVNCVAAFVVAQEAALTMADQETGGTIVLVGCADTDPPADRLAERVSKEAIPALTRCLAVECAARNARIRVNCVLPGGGVVDDVSRDRVARVVLRLIEPDGGTGACLPVDAVDRA